MNEYKPKLIIGGIEGGSTHSTCILINELGEVLSQSTGPCTNHQLIGMGDCSKRIYKMVSAAKEQAGITINTPLKALGLSLSGCEQDETNQQLVKVLKDNYPNISEKYVISSDTEGSLATTSNRGGIVCIAGTGSNTLLINPNGDRVQCGGWGYLLGDEGSAWKIAHRAIKFCFDCLDNFADPPYSIDKTWAAIKDHFQIECQSDLLYSFYGQFEKAQIAALCKKLADLARNGDQLTIHIFEEAGEHLARSIATVMEKADPELTEREGGVHILCVGSVWISWDLLKPGFISWIRHSTDIEKLSLMRLTTTVAIGAAYMAADKLGLDIVRHYPNNYDVFYRFVREPSDNNTYNVVSYKRARAARQLNLQ